jgi:hypothetical protein
MFPLQLTIERVDAPFSFDPSIRSAVASLPAPPRYHVTAVLLDVERRRTISYDFFSMVDPSKDDFENVRRTTVASVWAQIEKLRGLRDALNEILED